jgi:glycosyltransferase involved in cell wall biosynthesis
MNSWHGVKERNRMKICMINKYFYPWLGGREKQTQLLCHKLNGQNVETKVLTSQFQKNLPKSEFIEGTEVVRVPVLGRGVLFNLTSALSFLFWLVAHRKTYQILHIHNASCVSFPAIIAAKFLRKKTVLTKGTVGKLDGDFDKIGKSFFAPLLFRILGYVDLYIAVSKAVKQEIIEYGFPEDKILLLPNGVDTHKYKPISSSEKLKMKKNFGLPSQQIVTFVGRLIYRKGVDILVEAWKRVVSICSDVHLAIAGDGPEFKNLKRLAETLNLGEKVTFLGRIENVHKILQVSDFFVFPSRQEGLANAMLEAMASGLPIVATSIDGIIDVIKDGTNGILVKSNSSQELADALVKLVRNHELARYLGQRARLTVKDKYSLDQNVLRHKQTYERLLSRKVQD